jgi:hypothetical protein
MAGDRHERPPRVRLKSRNASTLSEATWDLLYSVYSVSQRDGKLAILCTIYIKDKVDITTGEMFHLGRHDYDTMDVCETNIELTACHRDRLSRADWLSSICMLLSCLNLLGNGKRRYFVSSFSGRTSPIALV